MVKKSSIAKKYVHLATKQPLFFYSILLFGIGLFLFLTLTTRIETDEGSHTLLYLIFVRAGRGL